MFLLDYINSQTKEKKKPPVASKNTRRASKRPKPVSELEKPKMQFNLRPYQNKAIELINSYPEPNSLLIQLATGGGKTAIFSALAEQLWSKKGKKTLVITHNRELLNQTVENLYKNARVTATNKIQRFLRTPECYHALVANIQCFPHLSQNDWKELAEHFDQIIVDECHHYVASQFCEPVIYFRDECKLNVRGFSATPLRADGISLKHLFNTDIICGYDFRADVPRLMSMGFLSPYELQEIDPKEAFGVDLEELDEATPDLEEYSKDQIKEFSENIDFKKVVDDWEAMAGGRKTIAFCPSIADSKLLVEEFNRRGIKASHIDGGARKTDENGNREKPISKAERVKIVDGFKNGDTVIFSNCQLISEGFDVPGAEVLILLSPTKSIITHLQRVGRVLRAKLGKVALILDYVGAFRKLGRPEDPKNNRFWRDAWEFGENDTVCRSCDRTFLPTKKDIKNSVSTEVRVDDNGNTYEVNVFHFHCPHCGHVNVKEKPVKAPRKPANNQDEEGVIGDSEDKKHFRLSKSNQTLRAEYLKDAYTIADAVADLPEMERLSEFFNLVVQFPSLDEMSIDECALMLESANLYDDQSAWGFLLAKRISACPDYESIMGFFKGSYDRSLRKAIWNAMTADVRSAVREKHSQFIDKLVGNIFTSYTHEQFSGVISDARELIPSERWAATKANLWDKVFLRVKNTLLRAKSKNSVNNLWVWAESVVFNRDKDKLQKFKVRVWDSLTDEEKVFVKSLQ